MQRTYCALHTKKGKTEKKTRLVADLANRAPADENNFNFLESEQNPRQFLVSSAQTK